MGVGSYTLCQSGEKVAVSGIYRLVETVSEGDEGTLLTLRLGEFFPDHKGRAACWFLVRTIPERKQTAPLHTPWQNDAEQMS